MTTKFSIVIPTYNEHDNIEPLLESINNVIGNKYTYEVLFIDDNSPDGTADLIRKLSKQYHARVIVRTEEKGLSTAVICGFNNAKYETVLVMDADLQHPPVVIPRLVQAIEDGNDIAVASRYVDGGGCEGWSAVRKIISRGALFISHLFLSKSRQVNDTMSGFFIFKKSVIKYVTLKPIGYKILLEILCVGKYNYVTEVPFLFHIRERGKSKLNMNQQIEYLRHIFSLMKRTGELMRILKFAIVGASGVLVNEGTRKVLTMLYSMSADVWAAPAGIELSIITNFILNNFFTFRDKRAKNTSGFFVKLLKYNVFCLIGAAVQYGIYMLLTRLCGMGTAPWDTIANLIGIAVAMFWNFFSNSWWTWKD